MTDEMDEMWALYADDGAQALDAVEASLDALQDGADEPGAHVGALFRAVHTFKGNSRVLGLANVEGLAHLAEDLIGLVRDEGVPLSREITDILLLTGDVLRGMLEETADTHADVDPEASADLKADLRALIGRLTAGPDAEAAPEPDPKAAKAPAPKAEKKTAKKAAPAAAPEAAPEPDTTEPEAETAPAAEAPAAAKPAFDPALASLLDQLDGGGGFDFDEIGEDEPAEDETGDAGMDDDGGDEAQDAPEAEADAAPVEAKAAPAEAPAEPEPAPEAPKSKVPSHVIAEVTDGKLGGNLLTVDPMYRQIFSDMVDKTLAALTAIADGWSDANGPADALKQADGLCYAAEQLDLGDWVTPLRAFEAAGGATADVTRELLQTLRGLYARDLGDGEEEAAEAADAPNAAAAPAEEPKPDSRETGSRFFTEMAEFYPQLADLGLRMDGDTPPAPEEREALLQQVVDLADSAGYVRVADAARLVAEASEGDRYRAAELRFYEELVAIERTLPASLFDDDLMAPSRLLGAWCSDHIFMTLHSLREGLESRELNEEGEWFPAFETLMRRVHFACVNYHIETASQLTMALIDLFARVRVDGQVPDVILVQMGRGFVDTMELVFDALDQGDAPDTARIEQMFEEATNVCFVASGVVTAKTIETRLGLPPEFHRVLSPESVKVAHAAMEDDLHFYVLRADLNDDDALAQGFLEWVTSGLVQMVTNVTVFLDKATLFDFLVASSLEEDQMVERLAMLDPGGSRLYMTQALSRRELPEAEGEDEAGESIEQPLIGDAGDSLALLEAVGAISASQALLEDELTRIASVDLLQEILGALRAAGIDTLDPEVRSVLRDKLEEHSLRLQEIRETGTQLTAELSHLQQESVARRSRPAEVLLRPLKAYVSTRPHKNGEEATLTYVGGDTMLDQLLIEDLRGLMKGLVNLRLGSAQRLTSFHVSVEAESDHVRVEITDNCPAAAEVDELARLTREVQRKKGQLRVVTLPGGAGMRFHLKVPQHMIVLDGMVVRVGRVRYVLPIDAIQRILQTDRLLPVAAAGNTRMLNMDEDGLVPVHMLSSPNAARAGAPAGASGSQLYVIVRSGGGRVAIPVDELLGQQLVLLRPLKGVLSSVRDMSGIAILSGGEVGMVVAVSLITSAVSAAA